MYEKMLEELKKQELMVRAISTVAEGIDNNIKWLRVHELDENGEYLKDENGEYVYHEPTPEDENEYSWNRPYSETKVWKYLLKCLEDAAKNNKIK